MTRTLKVGNEWHHKPKIIKVNKGDMIIVGSCLLSKIKLDGGKSIIKTADDNYWLIELDPFILQLDCEDDTFYYAFIRSVAFSYDGFLFTHAYINPAALKYQEAELISTLFQITEE